MEAERVGVESRH